MVVLALKLSTVQEEVKGRAKSHKTPQDGMASSEVAMAAAPADDQSDGGSERAHGGS